MIMRLAGHASTHGVWELRIRIFGSAGVDQVVVQDVLLECPVISAREVPFSSFENTNFLVLFVGIETAA